MAGGFGALEPAIHRLQKCQRDNLVPSSFPLLHGIYGSICALTECCGAGIPVVC